MQSISGKKILYVWKSEYPWDVRIDKICTSLSTAGADVLILAKYIQGDTETESYSNYKVKRFGKHKGNISTLPVPFNIYWENAILEAATEFQDDMIIVREIMLAKQAAAVAKKLKIPVIMDMAENYPALMRLWKKYRTGFVNKMLVHVIGIAEKVEKSTVSKMDGIIVVCKEQIDRLNRQYKYAPEKISVVHNTPLLNFSDMLPINPINDSRIVFCHHGHLTDEKKIDIFLESLLKVPNHIEKFKFIIAGEGESLDELKLIHRNAGSPENIIFLGNYKYSDLPEIISGCDYGVLPYAINDFNNYTIHNKIFDYFAFGKPVIVSQATPLIRIAEETGACISYDFSSSGNEQSLFNNIENNNYSQMSQLARKAFIEKYNWEIDSGTLINFIQSYF